MTTKTIKLIAFMAMLVHGVGHFQGVVASLGVKINNSKNLTSWMLEGLGVQANKYICFGLFLITGVLGVCAALSLKSIIISDNYWQTLAVITAFFSTACLVIFPNGLAMIFNKIGAIAVNLIIFYSIFLNSNWPAALFED